MKTSRLRVTGLCAGKSPVTGEFPAQMARTRKMLPFDDVIISHLGKNVTQTWMQYQQGSYELTTLLIEEHDLYNHQW